ncbi:uncharacterized protein THITE_2031992, partial [Thermothielavioides terrestris NRRL 8126]
DDGADLPIALRRTRRSLTTQSAKQTSSCASPARPGPEEDLAVRTPKSRKRRVRFSDPGPEAAHTPDGASGTGLTPMVRRARLSSGSGRKSRRHSTPAQFLQHSSGSGIPDLDADGSPFSGEVRFLPLRQVLDGRVKRRIRRNGLSEEMNNISAERRRQAREARAEIERLKAELAEKDDEIARLHDETVVLDTDRVWDLEQQVAALKRELASRSSAQQIPSSSAQEWTRAARDPFADDFMDLDVEDDAEDFGEATRAELFCSTPTRRMRGSFPTPPSTSPPPPEPQTPCRRSAASRPDVGIQASLPDPEKQHLIEELESLQLEITKLTASLESYAALASRLSSTLAPFSTKEAPQEEPSPPHSDIETRLTGVLQTLSDRTAALAELDSSLKTLGFKGSDAFEVIESLRASFRAARLELEYLTPGELTLPLTGAGAEVLDLVLARLRDLARKNREADDCIDEYHAIEQSLRQQLGARVDAMDKLGEQLAAAEREGRDKDARIAELELGLDRLKGAVRTYTRDIAELESLVERMDAERGEAQAEHRRATADLEARLAAALEQIAALQSQLAALAASHASAVAAHKAELAALSRAQGAALAQRDARVAQLRAEVDRLGASLRAAHEAVHKLRVENARLVKEKTEAGRLADEERRRAKELVDGMRAELERVARMSEGFFLEGAGPGEGGGSAVAPQKRRRYDSGLGLLDEEEVE